MWLALVVLPSCGGGGGGSAPIATGTLETVDCVVESNLSTCLATIRWSTTNAATPRVTAGGVVLATTASGSATVQVGIEPVSVTLDDGSRRLDDASVRGACARASAWDGLRCEVFAVVSVERAPTPFVENGRPVTLEVVLYTPVASSPPFPAVLFNHGSTGDGSDPSLFRVTFTSESVARFFAERGWLVAFPQRRGRGASDGTYDEGFEPDRSRYSCLAGHAVPGFDRALQDLDAATDYLRGRADVDRTRLLEGGFSRGGILAVAHVASRRQEFVGAVNFAGGWLAELCADALQVNRDGFLRGASFPGPSIWLYAESDSFYSVAHSRSHFDAFVGAGGTASFRVYTRAPGLNGHFLHNDYALWSADLGAWVAQF